MNQVPNTVDDHQRLATLYRLGKLVSASLDLDTTLSAIVQAAHELTGADAAAIMLLDERDSLVIRVAQGTISASIGERIPSPSGIVGRALREGRTVLVDDLTVELSAARPDLDQRSGTRAYLAAPLVWRSGPLGAITVGASKPGALGASDAQLITELAEQAAAAVAHAHAHREEQDRRAMSDSLAQKLVERSMELEQLQQQLVQKEKMSAIGKLVHGIAHEMNTPLGIVISNLAVLLQYSQALGATATAAQSALAELDDPLRPRSAVAESLRQALNIVDLDYILSDLSQLIDESVQSANRAATIVRSLSVFARRDPDRLSTVAIEETVDSAITLAWNALKHSGEVVRQFGGVPPVPGHASELTQVFVHLLLNAAQALEDSGGVVTVTTTVQDDQAVIAIADTGAGIPSEHLARVFDPFFTTRPPGQGTGLGLAVCHGIVARHGGTIDLESTGIPGQGATVTVRLPLVQTHAEAA